MNESKWIDKAISDFFRSCDAARAVGGIPMSAVIDGCPVPTGWIFDVAIQYYVPPNYFNIETPIQ